MRGTVWGQSLIRANRTFAFTAIPALLILVLGGLLLRATVDTERERQGDVEHTYKVIDSLRGLRYSMRLAESATRGFIIEEKPEFLGEYPGAIKRAYKSLGDFASLTRDNPHQQARAAELRGLIARRIVIFEGGIAAGKAHKFPTDALPHLGVPVMARIDAVIVAAIAEETALLNQRSAALRQSAWLTGLALVLAILGAMALMVGASVLLARSNAALARTEAERAHQAAILQATLDSIRDGLAVFESDGTLAVWNAAFFELLDFPLALARAGTPLAEFRAIDSTRDQPVLPEQDTLPASDTRYVRVAVGVRQLDVYRALVPNDGFLVAASDVTQRVNSENALRQAQKMEAVGNLTGGVAHDFNNLLQIVSANLDLIAAGLKGNAEAAGRLHNAIAAVDRGARLTAQLLAFARKQALDPRSTNLGRLVQDMTELLRRTLGEHVEVEASVAGGLWNTLVDPTQVENAILNLAINARDAMVQGGKLTVEIANAFLDDDYAAQHADVTPGQYVMIAVSDTGHGMPPDVVARVFDPFFTTKPEGRGTGLGLSQVYGFVKQSGGHIKIYSEVGHGTTVKLYLPRTKKPQEMLAPVSTQPIAGGFETILVAEDDEGVRAAVVDMLSELGYHVLKADNAEQALAVLASGVTVDLLFTDVVMPGPISTRELARRAQEMHPDMLVLYTSGYTQNAIVHNGRLDEDVFLLSKPYRKDDLARKLRSLLSAPKSKPEPARKPEEAKPSEPMTAPQTLPKLLIVEDEVLIRMSTVDMAESLGFAVAEAGNGPEALEILGADPDIAILLTDLGLPGMNGRELVAAARKLRPDLKVIIASGYSSGDEAPADPTVAYLPKPFDMTQLERVLREAT